MGRIDGNTKASVVEQVGQGDAEAPVPKIGVSERLTIELARLRSKFGADPAIAGASFEGAWMSPTAAMEEGEAEFIDAVADCLGVGLSLDAALSCWDAGGLVYEDADARDEDEDDAENESASGLASDGRGGAERAAVMRTSSLAAGAAHAPHASGRRYVIP